ncbi:hypothetical protein B7486_13065 [cyanobacterium TDX16]|nr:hypothetical protein B7486_13065 [cyanobacterium TDX16]
MTPNRTNTAAHELVELLKSLISLQESLHAVIEVKLQAMRRADVEGMIAAARSESELTAKFSDLDATRRSVVDRLCSQYGTPAIEDGRPVRLSTLRKRFDAPLAGRIAKLAETLKERMLKVAESNRVVELASRELLVHFKTLFEAMVQDESQPTYSAGGGVSRAKGPRVLDAVG